MMWMIRINVIWYNSDTTFFLLPRTNLASELARIFFTYCIHMTGNIDTLPYIYNMISYFLYLRFFKLNKNKINDKRRKILL